MNTNQFRDLYKFYQLLILETIEKGIKERGWEITKKEQRCNYSDDIASLELHIRTNPTDKEDPTIRLENMWLEFLFVDRDEIPRRVDTRIFNKTFGEAKAKHIAAERVEIFSAIVLDDREKLDSLGKNLGRLKVEDTSKKRITLHYENGVNKLNAKNNDSVGGEA